MSGSAIADVQDTYGAALIGLLVSTMRVFSLFFLIPSLSYLIHSLYGVTITQT